MTACRMFDAPAQTEQIEQSSLALAKQLRHQSSELRRHRRYGEDFKKRLSKTWGEALTLYEIVLLSARDAGSTFNEEHRPQAAEEKGFTFEALTSLHARACLVAGEVLELLKGGWPTVRSHAAEHFTS
jgi:hypothetical protein